MTSSASGKLALWMALVCSSAPSSDGSGLLALVFSLAHGHEHQISVSAERGHLDLVLAHARAEAPHGAPDPGKRSEDSETDHVFHLTADDATTSASRADLSAPLLALDSSRIASAGSFVRLPAEPRTRAAHLSRPVVLRL